MPTIRSLYSAFIFSSALSALSLPARSAPTAPVEFVRSALRRHRIVFLGDIHPLAEPKLIVAQLIREQREADGAIDLLALEVGADQQQWIDRYLDSAPEDTTILLTHPRTLRAHWGISSEYLAIYRAAYGWNSRHPQRPVHILAADLLGWPIAPLTPHMATGGFANRDLWMAAAFRKSLELHPEWQVLIFMGGYHGLKGIGGEVAIGRVRDRFDHWFAGYLLEQGLEVYTILADAPQQEGRPATRVYERLARDSAGNFAVALDSTTDAVKEPLYDVQQDGFQLEFWPSRFPLRTAADAMLILTRPTPVTLIQTP
jgi:hypothetical protein